MFNGSRCTVSQERGVGRDGTFLRVTAGQGLLFLCTQLSWRSRPPPPPTTTTTHPGIWGVGDGFVVDFAWVGLLMPRRGFCCRGCGVLRLYQSLFMDPHPGHLDFPALFG